MATDREHRAALRAETDRWIIGGRQGPKPRTLEQRRADERAAKLAGGGKAPESAPASSPGSAGLDFDDVGDTRRDVAAVEPPPDPVAVADEKRAEKKLRDEHARLVEMLREERARNEFLRAVRSESTPPTILRTERASGLREMAFVALASDWHVEEEVLPEKVGGLNEYNLDIADASVRRFFQAQIDLVEHHRASGQVVIRDGVLALMGDLFSGHIHEELMETTALSPVQSVLWLKERLHAGIKLLLDRLDLRSLSIPCSYGNHSRTTLKKRIATGAEHSYEWMMYRMLEQDFAHDPRVRFDTNMSIHQYVQAFDYRLHFTHGDSVGYGGGIGGITIPLMKAKSRWDDPFRSDISHVGHFHQLGDRNRVVTNGSLIGYNSFASFIRAPFEPPAQAFYMLDSRRGKCFFTPLWVRDDAREQVSA